jgi:arsenate reductase
MAEALLRKHGGDQFEAYSAGLEPKGVNPYAERVMKEVGIDLSRQYSKHVKEYMGKVHFAYLITVCDEAEEKCPTTFPGFGKRIHWPIEDPAAFVGSDDEKLAKFRKVRNQLEQGIRAWLKEQRDGK